MRQMNYGNNYQAKKNTARLKQCAACGKRIGKAEVWWDIGKDRFCNNEDCYKPKKALI